MLCCNLAHPVNYCDNLASTFFEESGLIWDKSHDNSHEYLG